MIFEIERVKLLMFKTEKEFLISREKKIRFIDKKDLDSAGERESWLGISLRVIVD